VLELPAAEPRVSVVIPALKESRNLPEVFSRLLQNIFEVILVDGVPSTAW
jgi:glycosyltransferase involved in cell wall biosynthesis